MVYDSFSKKIVRLIVLSLFSGIVMPMARVPVAQYVPSPAQFGGGQAVDKPVLTTNFVSRMSPETVAFVQQELSEAPKQVWTDQKLQKPRMSSSAGMFRSSMPRLMSRQEAYKFLNLNEQATPTEIKGAYRRLAKQYHPDVAGAESTEKMQALQQAYEILINKAVPDSSNQSSDWQYADFYREQQAREQADQNPDYIWETNGLGARVQVNNPLNLKLGFAIAANNIDLVQRLIKHGANPNVFFKQVIDRGDLGNLVIIPGGATPLTMASKNLEMVKTLLQLGARARIDYALEIAAVANDFVMVDLLLQYGAQPSGDIFKGMANRYLHPYQSRAKMVEKLCRAGVVLDNTNFGSALSHVSPEIIEGFVKSGITIPLDAWKSPGRYISNRMIPLLLEYEALQGLKASDVRAWYKREKEFLDRLIPGQPEPKYASLEGEKRSSKVDAQNAIKAMEAWFAKRNELPNESPEESMLQKVWRKMSGK